MRSHLYCSTVCAREAGYAEWRAHVRRQLNRPVPSRAAALIVLVALGTPMLMALRAVSQLDRLNTVSPAVRSRPALTARIQTVAEEPGGARIEGSAPAGSAVFLFAGARFLGAVTAEQGRFRFEQVRFPGPYRAGALLLSPGPAAASPLASPLAAPVVSAPAASPAPLSVADSRVGSVPDVTRGPIDRREILLSFDGGSSSRGTREILDTLRQHGIRTTVFLTGDFIRRYPDLTRQIAVDGHEVGNHTDTHPHLTTYAEDGRQATRRGVDRAFLRTQLDQTAALYRQATGREMGPFWRAPFGEQNNQIRRWAAEAGYWHVGWTGGRAGLDGLDWVSDPASPAYLSAGHVVLRLIANAENGGIVLLHLGSDREEPVALHLSDLVEGLERRGFRFVLASEFLSREGLTPQRLASLVRGDGH